MRVVHLDQYGRAKVAALNVGTATGAEAGDVSGSGELGMMGAGVHQIGLSRIQSGSWEAAPSDSTTVDIAVPEAHFDLEVHVGGYGYGSSGNVVCIFKVAGYGNAAVNVTIVDVVNTVGNGSAALVWQAAGNLRLTITNTHATSYKRGHYRYVLMKV